MRKNLQRIVSFTVIFALLCSCLGLAAFAKSEEPLCINVVTDTHFRPLSVVPDVSTVQSMPKSALYAHAGFNAQLYAESNAIMNEFLKKAASSNSTIILIPGDLVDGALKVAHIELAQKLKAFEQSTGKRVFVINGNNDITLNNPSCASNTDFAEIYADFGYNESLSRDPSSLSYSVDLDSNYRLLAIDSCYYGQSNGNINPGVLKWIEEQAQLAKTDHKHLIAMMHHALLRHFGGFGDVLLDPALDDRADNAGQVWEEFADLGIQYIFTGHMHANSITKDVSKKGNAIYDIETNCLVTYPCSYRTVTFSSDSVDIKTNTITSIDTRDLPNGYTPQQLVLIESDFRQYAYGYIPVSAQFMLKTYFVYPQNAINRAGLAPDSELAKLLMVLLPDVYTCFSMPLYKTADTNGNSIEEIAALGGYTLPASSYSSFFDVLQVIIGNYTCGDANMPGSSVEVRLLLDSIKAVLVYSLGNNAQLITPDVVKQFADLTGIQFTDKEVTAGLSSLLFRQSLANRFVKSLAEPFLEGVTKDAFPPGDVNVTLPPYAVVSQTAQSIFVTFFEMFQSIFEKFMKVITVFVSF
jgi:hypothetical protein